MSEWTRFGISAILTAAGLFVVYSAVLGVFKFKYSLNRVHAAALIDTLGMLFMLGGVIVANGWGVPSAKTFCLILFQWMSSPVASHLIGRLEITVNGNLSEHMEVRCKELVQQEKEG